MNLILNISFFFSNLKKNFLDLWSSFVKINIDYFNQLVLIKLISHSGTPEWPKYDMEKRCTMNLGKDLKVVDDPYGKERVT